MPKLNNDFWAAKLQRNVERDAKVNRRLTEAGWSVIRCWEHEAPSDVLPRVMSALKAKH